MSKTEKAPGRSANLTGAAGEKSGETVSDFHCTSGGTGRQGRISSLLLRGAEHAISGPELARMDGVSPRTLRLMVDRERLQHPICADDGGYYLPDAGNKGALELRKFLRRQDRRCWANRKVTRSARLALKEFASRPIDGQVDFWSGDT